MSPQKIKEFGQRITSVSLTLEERIKAIPKVMPTPINLMLLYSFFLHEREIHRVLEKSISEISWYSNVVTLYEIENNSPHISLLSSMAQTVLDNLGFKVNDNLTAKKTTTSKSKKWSKARKKVVKKRPPAKQPFRAPIHHHDATEIVEELAEELDDNEISTPNLNRDEETDVPKPIAKKKPTRKKSSLVYSGQNQSGYYLERTRGHRALDMIAFLIGHQLYAETGSGAGTVAVSLVKKWNSTDELVIATKYDVPKALIKKIVRGLLKHTFTHTSGKSSSSSSESELASLAKDDIAMLKNSDASGNIKHQASKALQHHKASLYVTRLQNMIAEPRDALEYRLANMLRAISSARIRVIANPFFMHPEIKLATLLFANNLRLSELPSNQGKMPYQYLGCSMLNCLMCDNLLRGHQNIRGLNDDAGKNCLVFFSKGLYPIYYPAYVLPEWAMRINKMPATTLRAALYENGTHLREVDDFTRMYLQVGDVSDCEEDLVDEL